MYSPFDMLRKKVSTSEQDPYYKKASYNLLNIIEGKFFNIYNVKNLNERKDFIKDFLSIEDFSDFIDIEAYKDKRMFLMINLFLLSEMDKIRNKGALYILRVWNLQPNL